jgi:hypothetical protein
MATVKTFVTGIVEVSSVASGTTTTLVVASAHRNRTAGAGNETSTSLQLFPFSTFCDISQDVEFYYSNTEAINTDMPTATGSTFDAS